MLFIVALLGFGCYVSVIIYGTATHPDDVYVRMAWIGAVFMLMIMVALVLDFVGYYGGAGWTKYSKDTATSFAR